MVSYCVLLNSKKRELGVLCLVYNIILTTKMRCRYLLVTVLKPGSHTSPMVGDSLSVVIRGENLQRILHISNHRQWTSPTSAIYENQALDNLFA